MGIPETYKGKIVKFEAKGRERERGSCKGASKLDGLED